MLHLKHARFVPELTEGFDAGEGDLLVRDGHIADILPAGSATPTGFEAVDLAGATLLPGLIDLHLHLVQWDGGSAFEALTMQPGDLLFRYYDYALAYARQGYTTIRDLGSDGRHAIPLSKAIARGVLPGPRIIACGLIVTPTETGNDSFQGMYNEVDGADGFMRACREEYKYGAHFLKLMASGAFLNDGGVPTQPIITRGELDAAVAVSRDKGGYVAAHCHSTAAIRMAIDAGVRTIEHGSFLDDSCIDDLLSRDDCFIVPTLATELYSLGGGDGSALSRAALDKRKKKLDSFDALAHGYKRGLKYGWGTDITLDLWQKNPGYEFFQRKTYFGCANLDLLRQATIYSAEIAGIDAVTGSIRVGKFADLVAVDGDPVADISVMMRPPLHTWAQGRHID